METLFRFALKRSPVEQAEETPSIALEQETTLQEALEGAQLGDAVRDEMKDAAKEYADTPAFITDYDDLSLGAGLAELVLALDALETDEDLDHGALTTAVADALGDDPVTVVDSDAYAEDVRRLRASIVAIKLLPEEQHHPIHHLATALRDLEVISRVASDDAFPVDADGLRRYRHRSLELPPAVQLGPALSRPGTDDRDDGDDLQARIDDLSKRFGGLTTAIDELNTLDGGQLIQSASKTSQKSLPSAELRPLALFAKGIENANLLSETLSPGYVPRVSVGALSGVRGFDDDGARGAVVAQPVVASVRGEAQGANSVRKTFAGRSAFRPLEPEQVGFRLAEEGLDSLSEETRHVLKEHATQPQTHTVDELVDTLRIEAKQVTDELATLSGRPVEYGIKRFGNTTVMIASPLASPWTDIGIGDIGPFLPFPLPVTDDRVPRTHAEIVPAGIADLFVVKQQLTGYEATDISHVENVLKSERKVRNHRRRRETEELTFRESETTTSEERDLETTDRFEMVRETSETINEEASLKAGLSVSGKYGPTVEFSASAEGALSRSKEQSVNTASTFAKDVTQRSATKITERVLERESLRVTNEVEDTSEHTLDNAGGDGHVTGIYQWIEKLYEAQMFNYGLRTMYDFMIPEPGAFLSEAFRRAHASAVELEKPMRFPLRPDQLTEYNYHFWIQEYGATDITPPPEPYRTESLDYSAGGGDDKTDYYHSAQVQVDEGYRAIHASVGVTVNIWDDDYVTDVLIGKRANRFDGSQWVWSTSLDNERESVPFAFKTNDVSDIAAVVEVKCQRTDRALDKWRHDTHAKLTQAYRARLAEYEEKLAALEVEAGIAIEGQSPAANQQLMRDELKKYCVSIMTDQHFDLFDAIETGSDGMPQPDLFENEAEGPYVRFFEQAFEWEHMTWVTYPYYWGRKSEWAARVGFEDADPLFNDFLKAGYCRVSAPVREGFEGAVDHFMTLGETWAGGPLPDVSSPLYLPIADELAERLDRPGEEIPEGDPWEVRLPTSLVALKQDANLPIWEKNDDGEWISQ